MRLQRQIFYSISSSKIRLTSLINRKKNSTCLRSLGGWIAVFPGVPLPPSPFSQRPSPLPPCWGYYEGRWVQRRPSFFCAQNRNFCLLLWANIREWLLCQQPQSANKILFVIPGLDQRFSRFWSLSRNWTVKLIEKPVPIVA